MSEGWVSGRVRVDVCSEVSAMCECEEGVQYG